MKILSVTAWATKNNVERRKAYRWVKEGKLPVVKRKITWTGIPENITVDDIVK